MRVLRYTVACLVTACAPTPPAPQPAPSAAAVEPYPDPTVWTTRPGLTIAADDGEVSMPHQFMRLEVLQRDTIGLRVSCDACEPPRAGYVQEDGVIGNSLRYPLEVSAWSTLPEFLLSLRHAAETRDLDALRQVMVDDFSYDFLGIQSPDAAVEVWRSEEFRSLDELPFILDRGVESTDQRVWASPPEFLSDLTYHGPRAGFRRRADGRWEWLFLIRGIGR